MRLQPPNRPPAPPTEPAPPTPPRVIGPRQRGRASPAATGPTQGHVADDHERPPRWPWLALGLLAAFLAQFVLPGQFAWFLAAIPHEMGHATIGCLLGHPSAPAISLAGHAWAGIGEFRPWLPWCLALALATLAWLQRERRPVAIALGALALALPCVARSDLADVLIAAGGHAGELAFAAYCYALCWSGGHSDTRQERIAGAMAGAMLQVGSLRLGWGLLVDAGARAHYEVSGSLGLKNDLLVLAEDLCDCRLQSVASCLLLLAVLALPLGLWWGAAMARQHGR